MPSYYVVLYRQSSNSMTIPVKAVTNEYDGSVQFAGGYPVIFGGTSQGSVDATLTNEVKEESRETLATTGGFNQYFQGQPPNNNLVFYWTTQWNQTGQPWRAPNNRDEGEMSKVVTVSIDEFSDEDPPEVVLEKLIDLTGAPGGSAKQKKDFFESETAAALVEFIYSNV